MATDTATIVDLRFGGDRLSFTATPQPRAAPNDPQTFDMVIEAQAHPFAGRVRDIAPADDLRMFAHALKRMTMPGSVIFGGDRMAELALSVEPQIGGQRGLLVVEISLTGGGDAWPRLTMLLFEQEPFWAGAADTIQDLLD